MCQELNLVTRFGYSEALVSNESSYVWDRNCDSINTLESNSVKVICRFDEENLAVSGWALHLSMYLSKALNISMKFVRAEHPEMDDTMESLEVSNLDDGDVYSVDEFWPAYNLLTGIPYAISSPLSDMVGGGILSLPKAKSMETADVIQVFDFKSYCLLFACALFISAVFRVCRQKLNLASKICKRSMPRQLFEMLLLISLEPRSPGLNKEKLQAIRIILTVSILSGLLMRKSFLAKINAIFAIDSYDVVIDLDEDLRNSPEINTILTNNPVGYVVLMQMTDLGKSHHIFGHMEDEIYRLDHFFNNGSVYFSACNLLEKILDNYPFIPAKLSELQGNFGKTLFYHFPINTNSPLLKPIYKWTQVAVDVGITQYIFREISIRERHLAKFGGIYQKLEEIYLTSKYFLQTQKHGKINVLTLGMYLLVGGFFVATAFLFREVYLHNCFGRVESQHLFERKNHFQN